ncbi:MAG TPA: hypothetical protein VGQ03_03145 [Nitrososphaera sp.]|jgi:hypothetical protein|nr:hypothetical protein [Nitrososphaera sp.]
MKSGKVPVTILLVPLVAATLLGLLYGPAVQALNPGNEIMAASDHAFQVDTFSLAGSIGSLIKSSNEQEPYIVTGSWALDVQNGDVSGFLADLEIMNANGSGYQTIQLSNLTSNRIELHENGTTMVAGTVTVTVNGTNSTLAEVAVTVIKLKAVKIVVDSAVSADAIAGQPIYGMAVQPELETASVMTEEETGLGLNNVTEKLRLPELPNPFR